MLMLYAFTLFLITREAVKGYLDKLAADGILAFHISNRHLRLHSVLANLAADLGLECRMQDMRISEAEPKSYVSASDWVLMARHIADFGPLANDPRWRTLPSEPGARVWTDDYSNVLGVMRFGDFKIR